MFQVGEKIAYPMYGAGTITDIVEKEVLGEILLQRRLQRGKSQYEWEFARSI